MLAKGREFNLVCIRTTHVVVQLDYHMVQSMSNKIGWSQTYLWRRYYTYVAKTVLCSVHIASNMIHSVSQSINKTIAGIYWEWSMDSRDYSGVFIRPLLVKIKLDVDVHRSRSKPTWLNNHLTSWSTGCWLSIHAERTCTYSIGQRKVHPMPP